MVRKPNIERLRRHWDKQAESYDRQMGLAERMLFDDTREWVCSQARGRTLEIAVGTGLNLPWYPAGVRLTGIDFSPAMLERARTRAATGHRRARLRLGDAEELDFPDASFDTVVCTFSLCAVPDERRAVTEMVRVLRPGGLLLLADHVVSTSAVLRAAQALLEVVTIRVGNEHFRRRPLAHVMAAGLEIERHSRFHRGMIERIRARKPAALDS
ncbi:class I SAM-dependent methyltransferase [Glycomyces tenuis]|nr:class I SAM-dependent methyltransferase [Glycomyces tenuis]